MQSSRIRDNDKLPTMSDKDFYYQEIDIPPFPYVVLWYMCTNYRKPDIDVFSGKLLDCFTCLYLSILLLWKTTKILWLYFLF